MTLTNHALTGALVAVAVGHPAFAIPLALLSHFAIDALPHFGLPYTDVFTRNKSRLFRAVVSLDTALFVAAFALLLVLANQTVPVWLVVVCILVACVPDFAWVARFIREVSTGQWHPEGRVNGLHKKVQWCEHPWGLIVEACWAIAMVYLITAFV